MNIKRPGEEFGKRAEILIKETAEYKYLQWDGREYEIQSEYFGYPEYEGETDALLERILNSEESELKDLMPEGIALYKDTLRTVDDKPFDTNLIDQILIFFTQHFSKQGLKVTIE